jgi:predicted transposase YbfD/YdcC
MLTVNLLQSWRPSLTQTICVVLGQNVVDAKSNEIPAVRDLLAGFDPADLHGCVVTVDAMHTQDDTAAAILAAGAHYVFTVKGNRPTLLKALKSLPWAKVPIGSTLTDRSHGRHATRTIKVIDVPALPRWPQFTGVAQVAQLRRTVTRAGKKSVEVTYVITSAPYHQAPPATLAAWVEPTKTSQYIARSFFPSSSKSSRNVLVNAKSLYSSGSWTPSNIMAHELGHVLGLRHEHTRPEAATCFEDNNWRPLTRLRLGVDHALPAVQRDVEQPEHDVAATAPASGLVRRHRELTVEGHPPGPARLTRSAPGLPPRRARSRRTRWTGRRRSSVRCRTPPSR